MVDNSLSVRILNPRFSCKARAQASVSGVDDGLPRWSSSPTGAMQHSTAEHVSGNVSAPKLLGCRAALRRNGYLLQRLFEGSDDPRTPR